ncbi:MAG: insulinase family protein [Candidatus Aminicenantes bacterium]|nr:insulinase family protein [Candidatus Aminicenantes bacterium]
MKQKSYLIYFVLFFAISFFLPLQTEGESAGLAVNIEKITLENGLSVFFNHDDSSAVTIIQLLINGGKRAEPAGKEGLAYLAARLLLEIPDQGKAEKLMSQSTRFSMNCMSDFSQIEIACLTENLDETLKLSIELFSKPLFSGNRISHLKDWMNQQRETRDDDSINIARAAFAEHFFKGTPYSSSVFGSKESLKSIKTNDVKSFYQEYFRTGNIVITVSSDLDKDRFLSIFHKHFISLNKGTSPPFQEIFFSQPAKQEIFLELDRQQSLVSIGFPLPKTTPRRYALALVLETLLGKGVNSLLWPLRSESRLAYNVSAQANLLKEGGFIEAYLETDNEKREQAETELEIILHALHTNGIEENELDTTKAYARSELLRDLETKHKKTSLIAAFENLGLGAGFINGLIQEIQAISLEEFNAYLEEILDPDKSLCLIVGPELTVDQ